MSNERKLSGTLGRYLKSMRIQRHWSLHQTEQLASIGKNTLSYIERGHMPNVVKLIKLAKLYETDLNSFSACIEKDLEI